MRLNPTPSSYEAKEYANWLFVEVRVFGIDKMLI